MRRTLLISVIVLAVSATVVSASPRGVWGLANHARTDGERSSRSARIVRQFLFGDRRVERTVRRMAPGSADAFSLKSRAAGKALAITLYVARRSRAKRLLAALYVGQKGHARRRLTSGTLKSPRRGRWDTVHVRAVGVRPGVTYWIAILARGGPVYYRGIKSRGCNALASRKSTLRSFPSVWGTGRRLKYCRISAYVSGTRGTIGPVTAPPDRPPTSRR